MDNGPLAPATENQINVTAVLVPGPAPQLYRFRYHGEGGAFFALLLKNILLTLITLGIYAAWAKTERRRFIWANVDFHGQRLLYTGTGKEIFFGYLKVLAVYAGLALTSGGLSKVSQAGPLILSGITGLVIAVLLPFAIYWSRRYLLSRTSWRGIRFGLAGRAGEFAKTAILGGLLSVITLGIYAPFLGNQLRDILTRNTRWGDQPFGYDGVGKEAFVICLKGAILSVVTLGIYYFWFLAELQRYYFSHTTLQGARGQLDVTGGLLMKLFFLNLLGNTLTLGIAFPWIASYSLAALLERTSFVGALDFDRVEQRGPAGSGTAEGLADVLNVDLGL